MNTELPLSPPPTDPDGTATDRVYEAIYLAVLEHQRREPAQVFRRQVLVAQLEAGHA